MPIPNIGTAEYTDDFLAKQLENWIVPIPRQEGSAPKEDEYLTSDHTR
jgi:hypothetical protein